MKSNVKFWLLIAALGITIISCQKEDNVLELNEQVLEEQTSSASVGGVQNQKRTCGSDQLMEKLLSKPAYRKMHKDKLMKVDKALLSANKSACTSPKVIPVAIHFQNTTGASIACLRTLAQEQVDIINDDFAGTNSDISKWNNQASSYFQSVQNGEACLRFCIADKNHPAGFGLNNGDPAITLNKISGDTNAQWSGYLNIFVIPNTGTLGYSPLGGEGNGDGVVIDATAFGTGNGCGSIKADAPFNLGRTLTHELGHYFLLDHIWGYGENGTGCQVDDSVADTPNQESDYGGCPGFNSSSCGSRDMHMNYMDYTNDDCMYMFSAGQISRSEAYVNSSLGNLTSNAANKCSASGGNDDNGGDNTSACETTAITSNVSNITSAQARVNWNAIPDAISYRLRYRESGTSSWTEVSTTQTNRMLSGLTASTTYQYQVRTQCQSGLTAYSSLKTFTTTGTTATCTKPMSISVSNLTKNSARLQWVGDSQANSYNIRYRKQSTSSWIYRNTASTSITLTGLSANTKYQYQIRTKCGSKFTGFTTVKTFTTKSNGGGNGCNGTTVTVEVVLDEYGSETSWEILNDDFDTVATGGPYADGQAGVKKTKNLCLPAGCYTLFIDDVYGDGICCDYGDGSISIKSEGQIIGQSDGYFGYYDEIEFCVDANGARVIKQQRDRKANKPLKDM